MTDALLDLTLTEDQRISRESMRRLARDVLRPAARAADEAATVPDAVLRHSAELGLALLPMPELCGGAGLPRSPMSNVLNAEDLAYGDMSLALAMLAPQGFVNALVDFGSAAQQEQFLAPLAQEHYVAASIALMEPRATFEPSELTTRAVVQGDQYRLDGEKRLVIMGLQADQLLVIADCDGEPAAFVVPTDSAGLTREAESYMGLRAVETATVRLQGVLVPADHRLVDFDLQRLVDLSRIGICALAVGCCQAVLDTCIPYVKERKAFGEPIAWRQSVAFMVADIGIELEAMRALVWNAASRAEQGLPFHREAYLARVLCADKAMKIGTDGIQLFGGAGFIRDVPLEMWYRNLRAIGVLEGTALV